MNISQPFSQFLFSTSRIVCRGPDARFGAGTGFVLHRSLEDGLHAPPLVTNKHVVNDMTSCQFFFTIGDQGIPRIGKTVRLLMTHANEYWHYHPNPEIDLAVIPIAGFIEDAQTQGHSIYYKAIADTQLLRDKALEKLDSSEEVCFIGYPNGLMDQVNLTPIIRRGYTASHSAIDFGGKPNFLIDALVLPGSSGSPVQLVRSGAPAGLLGVVNAFLVMDEEGSVGMEDDFGTSGTTGRRSLGLGNVINLLSAHLARNFSEFQFGIRRGGFNFLSAHLGFNFSELSPSLVSSRLKASNPLISAGFLSDPLSASSIRP